MEKIMNIDKYLDKLNSRESVGEFAVDSFPAEKKKRKKKRILRVSYPNENVIVIEQKRVMIDLDGTIHKYSKGFADGQVYDEPFDGAKLAIDWLKNQGYEIVIFTTRASEENAYNTGSDHLDQIRNVENWLDDNDIYYDRITAEKLAADFYIDDKAVVIKNGDWDSVMKVVKTKMKYRKEE